MQQHGFPQCCHSGAPSESAPSSGDPLVPTDKVTLLGPTLESDIEHPAQHASQWVSGGGRGLARSRSVDDLWLELFAFFCFSLFTSSLDMSPLRFSSLLLTELCNVFAGDLLSSQILVCWKGECTLTSALRGGIPVAAAWAIAAL